MSVVYHKMTGSGNDFVMIDARTSAPEGWTRESIARICDRRLGVGGDGLVFVGPVDGRPGAVRMTYFNSDGSPAPMCGNAALCSTRLSARLEIADPSHVVLVTEAATFDTRCVGPGHLAELHLPDVPLPQPLETGLAPGECWIRLGVVGVPHIVVAVDDVDQVDVPGRGRSLRFDRQVEPGGANVNFVSRVKRDGGSQWMIRTYERGIEAETLACGTGTVAAALALAELGEVSLPAGFLTASGMTLRVLACIEPTLGVARDIWLCGEGRLVSRGVWLG